MGGGHSQLGTFGELHPADRQDRAGAWWCLGYRFGVVSDPDPGMEQAHVGLAAEVGESVGNGLRSSQEPAHRIEAVLVDLADDLTGSTVEIGVVHETGLHIYVFEVVVDAVMVEEQRQMARVHVAERRRLRGDHQVGIAGVEAVEGLAHHQVPEVFGVGLEHLGRDVEPADFEGQVDHLHHTARHGVAVGGQGIVEDVDHALEAADDAVVVGLEDGDARSTHRSLPVLRPGRRRCRACGPLPHSRVVRRRPG